MAVASAIKGEKRNVISVIGDGSMSAGMAYEAMNNAGALKSNLIVILNYVKCKPKNQIQNLYALSFQMSNLNELWHDERNVIITAKKEIDANQFFQYLRKNLRKFADNSTFLFITGHHHKGLNKSNEAIVGETDAITKRSGLIPLGPEAVP